MLSSRIFDKRGFYRLSDEEYFFSLIYHAAYQKREFAQDYVERLTAMLNGSADDSGRGTDEDSREGTECTDRNSLKEKLEKYMSENGYEYSFVQVSQDQCKEVAEDEGKCRNEVKTIHRYANVTRVLQRWKLNRILYEGLPYVA